MSAGAVHPRLFAAGLPTGHLKSVMYGAERDSPENRQPVTKREKSRYQHVMDASARCAGDFILRSCGFYGDGRCASAQHAKLARSLR